MTFGRVFSKVFTTYKHGVGILFSRKYLFYTNVLLSIGISMTGDVIEQRYELYKNEIERIDLGRTGHMALSGLMAGIICHNWYNFIDRVVVGRSFGTVMKKLMLDQFICSPIIIMTFFATVALFEDRPLDNFTDEVRDKFWTLYTAEWLVWPPAQLINFYFLPTRFRVVYDNSISLGYDIYTSQVKHSKSKKTDTQLKLECH
ncbi:mpv17-like protein 2 [Achroia grisella]|uniref:mpv17-like protein 2 n=1 Tax=Achroia grisella TaxID=688607 RepID=UPI0027D3090E|nr:mpv17-like protein 2 [Achroia grisella]